MASGMVQSLRCRDIAEPDLPQVITLLTEGFADQRSRAYWVQAIARLASHGAPPGCPRFGTLLEHDGEVVGVLLQLFSMRPGGVRCNMSSWWVRPTYRMYGSLLVQRALRHRATYTNLTPAPHTLALLEAQGYRRFCEGRVVAWPWLGRGGGVRVRGWTRAMAPGGGLDAEELTILGDHAKYGCLCLVAEVDGRRVPLVFAPRRRLGVVGLAVLTWCPEPSMLPRVAASVGRYLAFRGLLFMVLDADGAIPGIPGRYTPGRPKYYRGPDRPGLYDHAYSERAMFGS